MLVKALSCIGEDMGQILSIRQGYLNHSCLDFSEFSLSERLGEEGKNYNHPLFNISSPSFFPSGNFDIGNHNLHIVLE